MGANQILKRIPRIKFPNRRAGEHLSRQVSPEAPKTEGKSTETSSFSVAPPRNLGVGGKASEQPKRTPVSEKEIEAILILGELARTLSLFNIEGYINMTGASVWGSILLCSSNSFYIGSCLLTLGGCI